MEIFSNLDPKDGYMFVYLCQNVSNYTLEKSAITE